MTNFLKTYTTAILIVLLSGSSAYSFEGPIQVRNQFPLFIYADAPYLEKAYVEDSFSVNFSYSSVYVVRNSARWTVNLDMEIAELAFRYRKKINDSFEFGIDVPLLNTNSGFLDGFLEDYHKTFGFPDYGRGGRPNNEFLYEVYKDGDLVVKGRDGETGIGDMRIMIKRMIRSHDPVISLKADIEIPTGKAEAGLGNGTIDTGFGILIDKEVSERFRAYLNAGAVLPGDLKAEETINLDEYFYAGIGVESYFWKNLGLLAQLFVQSSPFPETDISAVDRTAVLLTLGGRYTSGKNSLEFSFTEDPSTSGAPDFTMAFVFKRTF